MDFIDRNDFKKFADNLYGNTGLWKEICITGYFSKTIRKQLEEMAQFKKIKLIARKFETGSKRGKQNLVVLRKLTEAGVKIKVYDRMHARLFIAYNPRAPQLRGLLIIGSFDFNTGCLGLERYDAGIKTVHPDLIRSALKLFNDIWNDPSSQTLDEVFKK